MSDSKQFIYRIGDDLVINEAQFSIMRNSKALPLRNKSFQVLMYLIRNRSRVVPKDELLRAAWPDSYATDELLSQSLKEIRSTLGDEARDPRFVETLRRKGYRFVGEVVESELSPLTDRSAVWRPTLEGAELVGEELRKQEEANERRGMETAEAHFLDPENYRITPEKFYRFRANAQWLGIFRNWDSRWSFQGKLLERVLSVVDDGPRCPAAAIVGPSGSGKSVALRRLAVDLADQGKLVYWVEAPARLLRTGLSDFVAYTQSPCFLMLDDVQRSLTDEDVRSFQQRVERNPSLVLVLAGQELPRALRGKVTLGKGLFVPNETADRVSILQKIAKEIPSWKDVALSLATEELREARLIRLMAVLARETGPPTNEYEIDEFFYDGLSSDLQRIEKSFPGLARAIVDAAALREAGCAIPRETLFALADDHEPGASIPTLFENIDGNPRWQILAPLMFHEPDRNLMLFHHDELVSGIIEAGRRGLLGAVIGDDAWRRAVLDRVLRVGNPASRSRALSGFVSKNPNLISSEKLLNYIKIEMGKGNSYRAYLELIVSNALDLALDDRAELLHEVAKIDPLDERLWKVFHNWIAQNYFGRKRRSLLVSLWKKGCWSPSLIIPLLESYPKDQATQLTRSLIKDKTSHPSLLRFCIELLGIEAKDKALQIAKDPNAHSELVSFCLERLRMWEPAEARKVALSLLNSGCSNQTVLCRCLYILGAEARDTAIKLLNVSNNQEIQCACLEILGEEAKQEAKRLLKSEYVHQNVLCCCLSIVGNEAKEDAARLLQVSKSQQVICSCLEILGEEASEDVLRLLRESKHQNVIRVCLDLLRRPLSADARLETLRHLNKEDSDPSVLSGCLRALETEDAKPYALAQLTQWRKIKSRGYLLATCLSVARDSPEVEHCVKEMFAEWNSLHSGQRATVLRARVAIPERRQRAFEVVSTWKSHLRLVVTAALSAFWDDPNAVTSCCVQILRNWHREISYQISSGFERYDGHLIKALSHPALRDLSREISKTMLDFEAGHSRFLTPFLRETAENVGKGEWAPWTHDDRDENLPST
jgi:DNA-binding winged helix-turn-helix (wHTH) protein